MGEETSTRTVERALSLLAVICDRGAVSLADSARATALAPSTALRLLRTLEQSGFVGRTDSGAYRPGSRIVQLGAQALGNESIVALCRPIMDDLVDETGESVYLSVQGHGATALYLGIVEGTHSVRHASWVGRTFDLEGSAAGAALLGHTPADGWTVVPNGIEPDVTAIAAPVVAGGRVVAALSLVIPSYRVSPADEARHGRALAYAARRANAGLNGPPPAPGR